MTSYATLVEAEVYNTGDATWDAATDQQKQDGLDYGTKYIDSNYDCVDIDILAVPDDIKRSNSILALVHLTTPLWESEPKKTSISSESTDHGNGVKTSTSYAGSDDSLVDPHPDVSMLLRGYCVLFEEKTIGTASVERS